MDLDSPALTPPEGVIPNFDDPSNRNGLGRFVFITCSVFTSICFLLRMYGRLILVRKFQIEDALSVVGYGCFWGCIWAMIRFENAPGYYVHQWNVQLREVITMQYLVLVFGICFAVVLPSLKTAILIDWCRIFVPGSRTKSPFWWFCAVVIFFQVFASVAIIVALNTQCKPYKSIWYITMERKCWDIYAMQVIVAAIHLAGDVAIFLLPKHRIWTLKMSVKRRLGISIVFGLGLVACVAAGARLITTVANKKTKDNTYKIATLLFWAAAEMSCGFFVFCIPCLPNIIKENALARRIARAVGIRSNSSKPRSTDLETFGGSNSASKHGMGPTSGSRSYAKLDEEAYALGSLADAESQENLRRSTHSQVSAKTLPELPPKAFTVVCTTQISVVQEDDISAKCGSSSRAYTRSRDDLRLT